MLSARPNVRGPIPKLTPLLVDGLRSAGCDVDVQYWGQETDSESLAAKAAGRWGDILRTRRQLRERTYDILFVHTSHDWRTLARDIPLVALTSGPQAVVLMLHGSRADLLTASGHQVFKFLTGWLADRCDAVLLESSEEKLAWDVYRPAVDTFVVANPFLETAMRQAEPVQRRTPGEHVPTLLFVGRLTLGKGVLDLVHAFRLLVEDRECRLVVVGDGPASEELHATIDRLGLRDRVVATGYLSESDLARAYQEADVFVMPSYFKEGFPTVLAEAMGAGLPIVTTKRRGAADHLEEGVNALFVPAHRPDAIAARVALLLDDEDLRRRMSDNNRGKVGDFSPSVVAKAYVDAFSSAVRRHQRRRSGGGGLPTRGRPSGGAQDKDSPDGLSRAKFLP
jgi:glycosyltransferase involved in cell wall biosynthesis